MGIFDKLFGPSEVEKLKEKRDVEGLIKELQEANYCDAAEALRQIGDNTAVVPLINALEDHADRGEVCINVVNALGKFGDERAVTPLAKILENEGTDGEVCISIVNVLGQIGNERAIEALIRAFPDKIRGLRSGIGLLETTVGLAATYAVGSIGEPAVEPLIRALHNYHYYYCENSNPRASILAEGAAGAAHALGIIKDNRAIEPLIRAFESKYWQVRDNAAVALEIIGEPAIEPLTKALDNENKDVRKVARKILKKIQKK